MMKDLACFAARDELIRVKLNFSLCPNFREAKSQKSYPDMDR